MLQFMWKYYINCSNIKLRTGKVNVKTLFIISDIYTANNIQTYPHICQATDPANVLTFDFPVYPVLNNFKSLGLKRHLKCYLMPLLLAWQLSRIKKIHKAMKSKYLNFVFKSFDFSYLNESVVMFAFRYTLRIQLLLSKMS